MQLIADLPERADRQIEWSLPEVPAVHVDGHQVARALAALVENGLQATPETTGRIEVHAAPDVTGEQVMITILDNGTGMDATTLRRAFDPFFSKKPAGRRRGMGLPVALRLIESNGGTLRLDSREGAGTRALIHLPVAAQATQPAGQRLIA
jgi:signal transduction histidine kinase